MNSIKYIVLSSTIIFLTGAISTLAAQSPVSFGIKGGVNMANISGADYDTDPRNGFTIGASLDISIPLSPIGIESGAYFSQKGTDGQSTLKLDYIEVPVLAKISFGPPGPVSPHFIAGPYAGFNINAEGEISNGSGSVSGDISDQVEDLEFGGIAGLGLDLNLAVTKLNAQLRYSLGFTPIYTEDFDDGEKNSVFSIVVGIGF